jgi:hypothetical protein
MLEAASMTVMVPLPAVWVERRGFKSQGRKKGLDCVEHVLLEERFGDGGVSSEGASQLEVMFLREDSAGRHGQDFSGGKFATEDGNQLQAVHFPA